MINILLKPFIQNIKSYIRDDIDFLTQLLNKIPENSLLTTFDVVNLYTNISHELGLATIAFWLDKFPFLIHKRFSKSLILEGIKIILQNTNFIFNDQYYNENKGTAMGTKFAPTNTTLVLGYLEENMYNTISSRDPELGEHIKTNWKRFLDDRFMIWFKSELDPKNFHNFLNDLHPDMKFTIESSGKQLLFLDDC